MLVDFPDALFAPSDCDLVAIGAVSLSGGPVVVYGDWPRLTESGSTWDPDVIWEGYQRGLFPMPLEIDGEVDGIGWWSPAMRCVWFPGSLRVSRTLRRAAKRFDIAVDTAFEAVVRQCGDPTRPQGWIDENVVEAFTELHRRGRAHSVEAWQDGELVGGLYGVDIGGVFAGESMFHHVTDASKVCLVELAAIVGDRVIDTQWRTDHLASLGAVEIPRADYLALLRQRRAEPGPHWPAGTLRHRVVT